MWGANSMEETAMTESTLNKQIKGLYTATMVNVGIWAISLIALVILLQKNGNLKGMYVILAGGTTVGIQMIALVSKLKKNTAQPVARGDHSR